MHATFLPLYLICWVVRHIDIDLLEELWAIQSYNLAGSLQHCHLRNPKMRSLPFAPNSSSHYNTLACVRFVINMVITIV